MSKIKVDLELLKLLRNGPKTAYALSRLYPRPPFPDHRTLKRTLSAYARRGLVKVEGDKAKRYSLTSKGEEFIRLLERK